MQFDHLFDGLFFSCDLGFAKPEDGFFRAITQRLGHSESELLFFDDAFQNVTAAKAAGGKSEVFPLSLPAMHSDPSAASASGMKFS